MHKTKILRKKNSSRGSSEKNWRIYGLIGLIFFIALSIVVKLYVLQVARYDIYEALAENQHESTREITAKRGEIFFRYSVTFCLPFTLFTKRF
jgi:cell division protein FtsI/penicillin-binding protein 2